LKECNFEQNRNKTSAQIHCSQAEFENTSPYDWPNNPVDEEWFEEHPEYNRGVLLGEASDRLVDIDIDHGMALKLAGYFLPETELSWGRKSNPNSHWLYRTTDYLALVRLSSLATMGCWSSIGLMVAFRYFRLQLTKVEKQSSFSKQVSQRN
jgi:hypothetical protein